jgi:PilZ domain-containing protein
MADIRQGARARAKDWTPRRKNPRKSTRLPALVMTNDGSASLGACTVTDISDGGARLKFNGLAELPEYFILALSPDGYASRRCRVMWRSETQVGVQFIKK